MSAEPFPILPIKHRVLLPGVVFRLKIGKPATAKLIEEKILPFVKKNNRETGALITVVPIAKPDCDNPSPGDLHTMGCTAKVIMAEKGSESGLIQPSYNIIVEGISRAKIVGYTQQEPYLVGNVSLCPEPAFTKGDKELEDLSQELKLNSKQFLDALQDTRIPNSSIAQLKRMMDTAVPGRLCDLLCSLVDSTLQEKFEILEATDLKVRLKKTLVLVKKQVNMLLLASKIQTFVKSMKKDTEKDDSEDEVDELKKKIDDANLPEEPLKAAQKELKRIRKIPPIQPEYNVIRTFLECVSELPWSQGSADNIQIDKARAQLNNDHFGLEKVKKRILEFLAVKKLKNDLRGPILCFIGPPGVGKTSLGKSIADALGRKFHRISLGGVRDEAEVRGHRRTYVGALPGRIIQGLRKVGVNNPVILLDEIDKLGKDIRGDPASALLEVLDPEQNSTFTDHYLGVPFDLSKIFFIATANNLEGIPPPLLDRMEIVQIPGYTLEEKVEIAKSHLLPRQIKQHGIPAEDLEIGDESIRKIISSYTREAGVRSLERQIGAICRHVAVEHAEKKEATKIITPTLVSDILGPEVFDEDVSERLSIPGVVAGLSWTPVGGALLFIEVSKMPGSGKLTLTGQLGSVIKESAEAALTWVRSNALTIGLAKYSKESVLDKVDIHIHFPAGAVSKDGPSAGVTITTALVSLLSNKAVRPLTAMTGEITLRGLVLPVGGIKEKVLAAYQQGIKRVIIPFRNKRDLVEIPKNVLQQLEIVPVKTIHEVLKNAFADEDSLLFDMPTSQL